jgi:hypothetical protein
MSSRFIRSPYVALSLSLVLSLVVLATPRVSEAAIPESVLALAGPLAEQFGVPGSAVTSLLQKGISLDNVTQLLLVAQGAGKSFDQVTDLFRDKGNDVKQVADDLGVAADKYSPDKVKAAIDLAKSDAADAAQEAATAAAKKQAADSAGKAVGGLFGGKD